MKRFYFTIIALTAFTMGLIWAVGSGEAVQRPEARTILVADTVRFNVDQPSQNDETGAKAQDDRETLFKEIKKLSETVYDIKNKYMEQVDTRELIDAGIKGMLQNLDRYSVLMGKESFDRLMESTQGKYEGLGMEIDSRNDYIIVVTPMEGTPAYKMGLRSGDQIRAIDGKSTYKLATSDASKMMRGPAGTKVVLSIVREGLSSPIDYEVERAVIELKSVNYYGVIEGTNIGYVRLSRFAEETTNELIQAIADLKGKGIESLIFDLRSNGGGLLQQAVQTAELFVDEGKLIVYSRGQFSESERRYYSERAPLLPGKPLVILVDEGTASASEIVAGAIQDLDRGVIMGHGTYGKGLVQAIFPIGSDQDVHLKLTTARYYIPSGRCIQKPETEKKQSAGDEYSEAEMPADSTVIDSLKISGKEVFYTNKMRPVYGGGGILPDIEVTEDRLLDPLEINLERKTTFFDFAVKYVAEHPNVGYDIEITDDIVNDFRKSIQAKNFTYKTALEVSLDQMKEIVKEEAKDSTYAAVIGDLDNLIMKEKNADFEKAIDYIKKAIRREIITKIGGERALYEQYILKTDPSILQAMKLLKSKDDYARILSTGQVKDRSEVVKP